MQMWSSLMPTPRPKACRRGPPYPTRQCGSCEDTELSPAYDDAFVKWDESEGAPEWDATTSDSR
jgi:hypothetical protein